MYINRKENLIGSVVSSAFALMKERTYARSPRISCPGRGVPDGKYYLQVSLISPGNLLLQELVQTSRGDNLLFRIWTFKKEKQWDVLSLEKNKKHVYLRDISQELTDLSRRMTLILKLTSVPGAYSPEELESFSGEMVLPEAPVRRHGIGLVFQWIQDFSIRPAVFVPVVALALLVFSIVAGSYAVRFNRINREVDGSIEEYISSLENQLTNLNTFRVNAETQLDALKDNLKMEKADLEFNRHNAHVNIMRLAEELSGFLPARKEAYRLIAANVKDAVSFGEIVYEMSRLPTAEYQARIFLATDRKKIVPLGRFKPVFEGMAYPVAVEGGANDGMGFRITDGFMEKREDPLGTGGVSPHFAIDIVNVANIAHISYSGEIVREGNPLGDVIAVESGMIKFISFNEQYGWNLEVEHPMSAEVKSGYPRAVSWSSYYAHLAEEPEFNIGEWVEKGRSLGKIGNTGKSTGPHLHFEVRIYRFSGGYRDENGRPYDKIDPYPKQ